MSPEFQRLLQVRGHEGVVHDGQYPVPSGYFRHGLQVGHEHQGVGGAFHENRYHIIGDRFLEGVQIQGVCDGVRYPEVVEHLVQDTECASVDVAADDYPVPALEKAQDRRYGGHSGTECESRYTSFEDGDLLLHRLPGRVACPRVLVSEAVSEFGLSEGGCLIYRDVDGPCAGVFPAMAVDQLGVCLHIYRFCGWSAINYSYDDTIFII